MLLDKIRNTVKKHNLFENGDKVICAVSGGADSICLLHTLISLKDEFGIELYVANVNHLIRGEESDGDSEFVKEFCKKENIIFFYREYDVINIAKEKKLGEEECGRILRYEFFEEMANELGGAKIATAHNLNDNAETILFRLVRGSSARGLCGISHKRGNIVRPLLDVSRKEIEEYLINGNILWREDSTNKIPVYTRNKIRLDILPKLEEISSCAEEKIVSAARFVSEDNEYLAECAKKAMDECFSDDKLILDKFLPLYDVLKRRIVAFAFEKWGVKEINGEKIECFIEFASKENGKMFDLNNEAYALISYGKIKKCQRDEKDNIVKILDVGQDAVADEWKISVEIKDSPVKNSRNIAVFDYDKITLPLSVSYRKTGDKIALKGSGTKKLSDIFTDEKVERNLRDYIPVVRHGSDIIYLAGIRRSSLFDTDEKTEKFLVIKYERRG